MGERNGAIVSKQALCNAWFILMVLSPVLAKMVNSDLLRCVTLIQVNAVGVFSSGIEKASPCRQSEKPSSY